MFKAVSRNLGYHGRISFYEPVKRNPSGRL